MDKEIMKSRLIDLTHKTIDLVPLVDLTVYNVSRELKLNSQNNYQIDFWVKEPFNNKDVNSHHYLYRHNEGDAYEILSLLIRMEKPRGYDYHNK
jgi:hypothetical protein